MQQKQPTCSKHDREVLFVCTFQSCKQHRILCELCKQKQTLHFSNHANYMHKYEKVKEFDNGKKMIPQLEKGIGDCQNFINQHKRFYTQQLGLIKEDFNSLRKIFCEITNKYEQLYSTQFTKQMDKFDSELQEIKKMFKEYVKQKNQQDSFFTLFFQNTQTQADKSDQFGLEALIKKNYRAFKTRADIISLRSTIAIAKNNQTQYKRNQEQIRKFNLISEELDYCARIVLDKFKDILASQSTSNQNLKNSIVSQVKSLAFSRVSVGNLVQIQNDLRKSQLSINSDRSLQRVSLPALNPIVGAVRQKLKPLEPRTKGSIVYQGPYLYTAGVYYGQFQNGKRNGWGQFVFNDGSIYQGQWQKDLISGYGRLIRSDCYYEGNVKNGKACGAGNYQDVYRYYSGEWKNDKRNGTGQEELKNKSKRYVGSFLDDKYNGKGKLVTQQYIYQGKFKDGVFDGDGKIKYNNGQIFQGNFVEGEKNFGRHTYPDGSYYDGMFKDNIPSGTGQFYWADGLRYNGQWRAGIQQGVGVQIHQDGRQLKGIWKNGRWEKWM